VKPTTASIYFQQLFAQQHGQTLKRKTWA